MIYFETLNVYQYYIAIAIKDKRVMQRKFHLYTYICRFNYVNNPGYLNFTCTFFYFSSTNSAKNKPFSFANLVIHHSTNHSLINSKTTSGTWQ